MIWEISQESLLGMKETLMKGKVSYEENNIMHIVVRDSDK